MDSKILTLDEATSAFDVSPLTLRRRAQYGELEGAVKLRGKRGPEWRVPAATLEALGYQRREPEDQDVEALIVTVGKLTDTIAEAQRENARLNRELGGAVAEAAALRRELDALQAARTPPPRRPTEVVLPDSVGTARAGR